MAQKIDAVALRDAILDGDEIAVFDVREEGVFGQSHLLRSISVPLSRFEFLYPKFAPRPSVRVILMDANDGLAARAADILAAAGYSDISILQGGVDGWGAAGFELFSGVNVPSKVFGEHVEHHCGTPNISAQELKAKLDAGENMVILDSRPKDEYHRMNIPTGIDSPGAELAYHVRDLAPDPDTLVVVNCAGRTRSIIGAQSLINAGTPNKVMALTNGTMGWHLAGFELENGATRKYDVVSDAALDWSRDAAKNVAEKYGVRKISAEDLARWREESGDRSLYTLDVRSPEEFAAGTAEGFQSAPGGQLVQATDVYVGTYNARIVLGDDTGVRATMTASWLVQMGWPEVFILDGDITTLPKAQSSRPASPKELASISVNSVSPAELKAWGDDVVVLDVGESLSFRDGHIPGAWWIIRARLKDDLAETPSASRYVVTSADGVLAKFAAAELKSLTDAAVFVLEGGDEAWTSAGEATATGWENLASAREDIFYKPYDREGSPEEAMQQYLTWEIALVEQIKRDGTLTFPHFDPV
ncbi:MAG: thiosulfate sulfurtransferase [Alphaproteobacteria bacterium]|nr:thiosulfate sulfurtransferase [Alphaproteobacteria bacterium]